MTMLNRLYIKGTSKTPEVDFTPGVIEISGRSIPEDSVAFYQPLVRWIENYVENPEKFTKVNFRIEYINSGSNRFIYSILKILDDFYKKGNNISITWYFEEDDDTIKGLGNDLKTFLKVPVTLMEITS
ncbi:MAG TPA: DUF1987 domain-containing protein [Tenuifilaceae bacterium]|nr:DUF1987 domain-containing protein [Tenuifilaceae bacterium]HPE18810.1 DUF1987 domain-containing protein [Tenuifilaceae bacterium]HPJ46009.1 DUF1987 domain-containing protein [Tenuifilaceae bacterium]HPQ34389.1 DUF1987 domain-containing protein [Tenuifilaceae bacterium]HRX68549.1 DUF1987 domain-containing protein [Tenuifilaceae bacterium]